MMRLDQTERIRRIDNIRANLRQDLTAGAARAYELETDRGILQMLGVIAGQLNGLVEVLAELAKKD